LELIYFVLLSAQQCHLTNIRSGGGTRNRGGGVNQIDIDFTRVAVKDLHSRVLVAVQEIDFISKSIQDPRDEDLPTSKTGAEKVMLQLPKLQPVRSAYQPPASSTFLSERTSHQQPASSTLL
jgi:hypothetical protein